jgi:hypothetical protein
MARLVDLFLVYQFIVRLITPFSQWQAFKLGIIDEKGNVLRKRATLNKPDEKEAWGYFDILAANLKKLLAKIPGGESKVVSYAAAGLLIKEQKLLESMTEEELEEYVLDFYDVIVEDLREEPIDEEPANVAGSGAVAGLGVGPQGEPGYKKKRRVILSRNIKVES